MEVDNDDNGDEDEDDDDDDDDDSVFETNVSNGLPTEIIDGVKFEVASGRYASGQKYNYFYSLGKKRYKFYNRATAKRFALQYRLNKCDEEKAWKAIKACKKTGKMQRAVARTHDDMNGLPTEIIDRVKFEVA
jgi:hypothetical protein